MTDDKKFEEFWKRVLTRYDKIVFSISEIKAIAKEAFETGIYHGEMYSNKEDLR